MTASCYEDLVARSPDGALRVEARSPDNRPSAAPRRRGVIGPAGTDQRDFTYALFDEASGAPRWRKGQELSDLRPRRLWLSNHGWLVILTHSWMTTGLVIVTPRGEAALRVVCSPNRHDPFPARGFADHISWSSAGPSWTGRSIAQFVALDGRERFSLRTWWGYRVLLDLEGARVVCPEALDPAHERRLVACERAWVMRWIEAAVTRRERWLQQEAEELYPLDGLGAALAAVHHAGRLGVKEAVPLLRSLESLPLEGLSTRMPIGDARWGVRERLFTAPVKHALWRLGERPAGYPSYDFEAEDGARAIELGAPAEALMSVIDALPASASQPEVLRRVGVPDFMLGRRRWEYDFRDASGVDRSARIEFVGRPAVLTSVDVVAPGWRGEARD